MTSYAAKIEYLVELTAIQRNVYAARVQSGKMSQEQAQEKLDILEAILGDYQRKKLVNLAGILCSDTWFKTFVGYELGLGRVAEKDEATDFLRSFCGIKSRRDLAYDSEARSKFADMRQRFSDWRRYKQSEAA